MVLIVHFEDMRTPAMKAAGLELGQIRSEFKTMRRELAAEGEDRAGILRAYVDVLEDRLARLYCEHYELQGEMERIS